MSTHAPQLPHDDELLTTSACANLLLVSKETLERWRCEGGPDRPPFIKYPGKRGRVVYSLRAIRAYLAARQFTSTSEYSK